MPPEPPTRIYVVADVFSSSSCIISSASGEPEPPDTTLVEADL